MKAILLHDRMGDRTFALVLDAGEEALAGLREFAREANLTAAHFTAIGAFRDVVNLLAIIDFQEHVGPWPDAPKGRTRREIIALKRGLPVFRGIGTVKAGVNADDALRLAEQLPPPTFAADRRLRDLDRLA